MADIGTMQEQLQALEAQLGSSVSMVAAFDGELSRMRETMVFTGREVNTLSNGISGGLRKAFEGLVFDGMKLNDALKTVAGGINRLRSPERGFLLITHYQRLLDYVKPDKVHVLSGGRIVRSGGPELAHALEREGYGELAA